jgi:two-component system, chemotaxis family, chemotaxis protein CheY
MLNRSIKMLVADDAQAIRSIFRKVAERSCGLIELVEAQDGRECMKALSRGDIDLAFIDVYMPEMSGLEALRNARHVGIRTFVTLMSGPDSDHFMKLARQLRAYEFLRKPFGVRDIESIIITYQRVIGPTKVLIVDDSMTVRKVVQQVLGGSIFRLDCYEAPDGETALAYCDRVNFDIVFLDCNMPGLDGLTTLDRLMLRNSDARVVMISGEKGKDQEQRALKRGAAAFLAKPFQADEIDAVLHDLFGLRLPDLMTWGEEQAGATGRTGHKSSPARASGGRQAPARTQ